jgi:formamidopyrimidine-DNA glycosylase
MPELPEVETVRAGLERLLRKRPSINRVQLQRADLRSPFPKDLARRLTGQPITGVARRAKYLIFETPAIGLLCHLGMTGTWRVAPSGDERVHDHCYLHLSDGRRLAFRDPRRFGLLDLVVPGKPHPRLSELGPEPLSDAFSADFLQETCRGRKAPIKSLIMDQRRVVGVGNIYAAEALFRAGIRPTRPAGRVSSDRIARLVDQIQAVLREAIAAGGSTISDFRQAGGDNGYFQNDLRVYDRAGQPCRVCGSTLKNSVLGGRSTVWCKRCQR